MNWQAYYGCAVLMGKWESTKRKEVASGRRTSRGYKKTRGSMYSVWLRVDSAVVCLSWYTRTVIVLCSFSDFLLPRYLLSSMLVTLE